MKIILVIYIAFFYTFDTVIESKMMFEDQVKSTSMLNLDSAEQLTTEGCSDNQECPDCDTHHASHYIVFPSKALMPLVINARFSIQLNELYVSKRFGSVFRPPIYA